MSWSVSASGSLSDPTQASAFRDALHSVFTSYGASSASLSISETVDLLNTNPPSAPTTVA